MADRGHCVWSVLPLGEWADEEANCKRQQRKDKLKDTYVWLDGCVLVRAGTAELDDLCRGGSGVSVVGRKRKL